MPFLTLKVLAGLLQLHGPGATIQSDHQGIDALLNGARQQSSEEGIVSDQAGADDRPVVTHAYFRRGGFVRGPAAGAFRRAGYAAPGAFRRGFARGY